MRYEVIGRVLHVRDSTSLFSISPIVVHIAGSPPKSFVWLSKVVVIRIKISGFLNCLTQTHISHSHTLQLFSSICHEVLPLDLKRVCLSVLNF